MGYVDSTKPVDLFDGWRCLSARALRVLMQPLISFIRADQPFLLLLWLLCDEWAARDAYTLDTKNASTLLAPQFQLLPC